MKKILFIVIIFFGLIQNINAEIKRITSGNKSAKITIIAYESLTCSHCADFHNDVYPQLKKEYIDTGLAKIEFRHFPLDIAAFNQNISAHIMCAVRECLKEYLEWYPFLKNFNYHSTTCLLQKTKPTEGYHDWHSESNNIACANRTLVWSVYFNDVKEGGETEFLYQKQKIKSKRGRVLIFPGSFTHLHRGNPPYESKYIATGWLAS